MQLLSVRAIWNAAETPIFAAINRTNKAKARSDNPPTMQRICGVTLNVPRLRVTADKLILNASLHGPSDGEGA